MCNSPMATGTDSHTFDANQNEMMEKSTQEWSEQLEKEFFNGKCVSLLCSDIIVTRSDCDDWFQSILCKHIDFKDTAVTLYHSGYFLIASSESIIFTVLYCVLCKVYCDTSEYVTGHS